MQTDLLITLQNYGFSEKEAKIYLTTLELGSSIASTIARRAGIKRVTAYSILKDLKERGIANEITKEEVKFFSVISPELLLKQLQQKYESFKNKMPDLMAMAEKFGDRPKVQFFEGFENIKKMYDNLLMQKSTNICSFLGTQELDERLRTYLDTIFVPKRVKEGISAKVIVSDHRANHAYYEEHKEDLVDILVIKEDIVTISNEIDIFGEDKIMIVMFSPEEMSGMIIQNKNLHNTLKNLFNFVRNTKISGKKAKKK